MALYAVGDIQGCYAQLNKLLNRVSFDTSKDTLFCVGDVINRGPKSLKTLRFLKSLGDNCNIVLGNHDIHFLAMHYGIRAAKSNDTLLPLLNAPEVDELAKWLRRKPLLTIDQERKLVFCHAGIYPWWDLDTARSLANEVESVLHKRKTAVRLLGKIYSNEPSKWHPDLGTTQRLRFTINALTRMRFVSPKGHLNLVESGYSGRSRKNRVPWFDIPNPGREGYKVIFGHWSALGFLARKDIVALDTGCVWGRELTMVKLPSELDDKIEVFQQV